MSGTCYHVVMCIIMLCSMPVVAAADIIIFSFNRPMQLYALLESMDRYLHGVVQAQVIVRASNSNYRRAYEIVFETFDRVHVHEQQGPHDFKKTVLRALDAAQSDYVLFAVDDIIMTDYADLDVCVEKMQHYDAYGFYLRLGKNYSLGYPNMLPAIMPPFEVEDDTVLGWRLHQGNLAWSYPHTVDMTIYRRYDVVDALRQLNYSGPNLLEAHWCSNNESVRDKLGLCLHHSVMVNIPANRVQQEFDNHHLGIKPEYLLDLFLAGKKIDINPFYKIDNKSCHIRADFTFVART